MAIGMGEKATHSPHNFSEGQQLTKTQIVSGLQELQSTGARIMELAKLVFTGGQSMQAKKAALIAQRAQEGHAPQVAAFKKWSGGVVSRADFEAKPFTDFRAQKKQGLSVTFDKLDTRYLQTTPTDQIKVLFGSGNQGSSIPPDRDSQPAAVSASPSVAETNFTVHTSPESAAVNTQLSWIQKQLHQFQTRLTQAQDWATRLNQRLDQTALGQAAIQAFGTREEKLKAREMRIQMKLVQRLQASTKEPTGLETVKNMGLDIGVNIESISLQVAKVTSFLSAFNQTVTGFMLKDVIYHYGFEWWLGRLIKAGWTTSLDQIIGEQKAGKATDISLQELAGRLEECFLKDEYGFGVRSGSITPERFREAMVGGLGYALKMNLLPTFLGRLPSIKALGANPGELRQLAISTKMAFGGIESVKKLIISLKQAKTNFEKAALVSTSFLSGLSYAVLSKLSPTLAEGEMGGANLVIMLNTLFSNLVGEMGQFIQRSETKTTESHSMKWLHAIQTGIATYNATQSAASLGDMVAKYVETGSVNPVAQIKTEEELIKLATEHPEYFLGQGGWIFGEILRTENQVIGAISQFPARLVQTVKNIATPAEETAAPSPETAETPALLYQLNTPKAQILVFHSPTENNPNAVSVMRVANNGEVARLETGGSFVVVSKAQPTIKNWLKNGLGLLFTQRPNPTSSQPVAVEVDQNQSENEPSPQPAVHDYYFSSKDGRQVMIRIDLVAGETLGNKFARLLDGQVDDDISALDAALLDDDLGETIRSLSSDELDQHAGADRVLEGQIYRDFIQPLQAQAHALGISDEVLLSRLVDLFEGQQVNSLHSKMCMGEFNQVDLMRYLLQDADTALPPPTLTIFDDAHQVYHDQEGIRLALEPGQGLLASLRASLPESTVINLYRSLVTNQVELLIITSQGIIPVEDINLIPSHAELMIRAVTDEGRAVIDEVPTIKTAVELLTTSQQPSLLAEQQPATRPPTFVERLNQLPTTKPPDQDDSLTDSPPTTEPVEPDLAPIELLPPSMAPQIPSTGPPIETDTNPPGTSRPEPTYSNPTLYNNSGDAVTMMGIVQAGDTLSGIVARFLSSMEGSVAGDDIDVGTWDIIRATKNDTIQLAVVDESGNPIRVLNALSSNPKESLIRPGERIALIQTDDDVQFEFGPPPPPPPPLTKNLIPRATDPPSTLQERQLLTLLQQTNNLPANIDLSETSTYTDPDIPDQIIIIDREREIEYRLNPVTLEFLELQRNPVTQEVEVVSSQAGILTQFEIDLPNQLVTTLANIPITNAEARRNAISLAVQRGQFPIPDNFKTLYNALSSQLPTDEQGKVTLLQAWARAVDSSCRSSSTIPVSSLPSLTPDSPVSTETSTTIDLFDMLQGMGMEPVEQLTENGRLSLQRVPLISINHLSITEIAESLGVNSSQVVIVPDGPGYVRISLSPGPEDQLAKRIVETNRQHFVYTVQNDDGSQTVTLQPKPTDNVVSITRASIDPDELIIRPGLTAPFREIAGKKVISTDPTAQAQEIAIKEQDLECVVLSHNPPNTITTEPLAHFPLPISALTAGGVEELSHERLIIEAAQLLNETDHHKALVSDDHQLLVVKQEGQPTRVLAAVSDAESDFFVTTTGQQVYFDVASQQPIVIDDKGNLISATNQNLLPLSEFVKQYGLSLATSGSSIFHHEGKLVYVNEDGMLVTFRPNGVEVIGSVINASDLRTLGKIDISTYPVPPEGISFTDIASLSPSEGAMTLFRQFFGMNKHNLFISPDGSKIQYEGKVFLPSPDQVMSDGRPLFIRQEDDVLVYATGTGFSPINSAVHTVIPKSDLETVGIRPATVKAITFSLPRIIAAAAPVNPANSVTNNTLIHIPTGLPVMEESGNFFVQMATGREEIGNLFNSASNGNIQVQLPNGETRPLNLFEVTRVLTQSVPADKWMSVWPKVAIEKVASQIDLLLAPAIRRFTPDSLAPIDALAQSSNINLSPQQLEAISASEERAVLANQAGFSIFALARAVYDSIVGKEVGAGGGGGTIAMQLARQVYYPESIGETDFGRKLNEICMAAAIRSQYSSEEIVKMYAAVTNYGNGITNGIDAGANYLFGANSHEELSEAETIMLTVVSQQPGLYNLETIDSAQKWIERAKRFVGQLENRQEISAAQARQLELEIEDHLPTTLKSISQNELRTIFRVAHDRRAVMSAFAKLVMTGQASQINLFRYLERTGAITPEESRQIQGKPASDTTSTAILEPIEDETQPPILIRPVGTNKATELGPTQITDDIHEQSISPLTLEQVFAYSEDSSAGENLREEAVESFKAHLFDSPDTMKAFGLNPDVEYLVDESISVEMDGSFGFNVRNSSGQLEAIIYAGRTTDDKNDWAIITGVGPSAGFHLLDLRKVIEPRIINPISKEDPDSGLIVSSNSTQNGVRVTFHHLGIEDVEGGVFPALPVDLVDQVTKAHGSQYHLAVYFTDSNNPPTLVVLRDLNQAGGGCTDKDPEGKTTGLNSKNIHVLMVYDDRLTLSDEQLQGMQATVGQLVSALDVSNLFISPTQINTHGILESTQCAEQMIVKASDEAVIRTYQDLHPDHTLADPSIARAELATLLNRPSGDQLTVIDLIALQALKDQPVATDSPSDSEELIEIKQGPQPLLVDVEEATPPQASIPHAGASLPFNNGTKAWLPVNVFEEIQADFPMTPVGKTESGEWIVFNQEAGRAEIIKSSGHTDPLSPDDQQLFSAETLNDVLLTPISSVSIDLPESLKDLVADGAILLIDQKGAIYVQNNLTPDFDQPESTTDDSALETVPNKVVSVGQLITPPVGPAIIVEKTTLASGNNVGNLEPEILAATILNTTSAIEVTEVESSVLDFARFLMKQVTTIPSRLPSSLLRLQQPHLVSQALKELGVESRPIELLPTSSGREAFEQMIRVVVNSNNSDELIVWLDLANPDIQAVPTDQEGSTVFVNQSTATPVRVLDLQEINSETYVVYEIATGIGGRTQATQSALSLRRFIESAQFGRGPLKALIVGSTAENSINPELMKKIHQQTIHGGIEGSAAQAALGFNYQWPTLRTQIEQGEVNTTINPKWQKLTETIMARYVGRSPISVPGGKTVQPSANGTFIYINTDTQTAELAAMPSVTYNSETRTVGPTATNRACTEASATGSTAKILTLLAALQAGLDQKSVSVPQKYFGVHNWERIGAQRMRAADAVIRSNNPAILKLVAEVIGIKNVLAIAHQGGWVGESQVPGLTGCSTGMTTNLMAGEDGVPRPPTEYEQLLSAIGQGGSANTTLNEALFLALMTGSKLVFEAVPGQSVILDPSRLTGITPAMLKTVRETLYNATNYTAGIIFNDNNTRDGWRVMGKTGTAETSSDDSSPPHVRFAGLAERVINGRPTGDIIAFSVVVPYGGGNDQLVAQRIVRDFLQGIKNDFSVRENSSTASALPQTPAPTPEESKIPFRDTTQ